MSGVTTVKALYAIWVLLVIYWGYLGWKLED